MNEDTNNAGMAATGATPGAEGSGAVEQPQAAATQAAATGVEQQPQGAKAEANAGAQPEAAAAANDVADAMRKAYAIAEPVGEENAGASGEPGAAGGGEKGAQEDKGAEYKVEYPEGWQDEAAFTEMVTPIARESGIDGKTFGKVTAQVLQAWSDAEYANMAKTDKELKEDWGADYDANMKAARAEAAFLKREAGLTDEDLRVFACPKGMRALYAISRTHGERAAAGTQGVSAGEKAWAEDVMKNPANPDYHAFHNVSDPRWRLVNERYNRAIGMK